MKLYTEKQIKIAIAMAYNGYDGYYEITSKLLPIELPSDEEIQLGMSKTLFISPNPEHKMFNAGTKAGFTNGAKWVIEKIKQQADGK